MARTMRAAELDGKGGLRMASVAVPRTPPRGALVRVTAVGICGSDLHKFRVLPAGSILGHEIAGVVERVGRGAPRFRVGDRIASAHHIPCGRCVYCRGGNESQCALFRSTNLVPGGWAEYAALSRLHLEKTAFRVPPSLTEAEASLTEPLACCVRAVRRSGLRRGDAAVVVGLGAVGSTIARLLRDRGVRVLARDILPEKLLFARRFAGAAPLPAGEAEAVRAVLRRTKGRGADQVLLAAGVPAAFAFALRAVRRGGAIHWFAAPDEGATVAFDPNLVYKREVRVFSTYSSSPADLREAFRLIRTGAFPAARLISHRLPLERIAEGIRLIRRGAARKIILEPGASSAPEASPCRTR